MKKALLGVAILGMAALGSPDANAQGSGANRDFTIDNTTAETVTGVWTSTPDDSQWHGLDPFYNIPAGRRSHVTFKNYGPCLLQIRVRLASSGDYTWNRGFNFCSISTITLYFDGDGLQAEYQ